MFVMDLFWTGPLGSILRYFVTKKDNLKKENEMNLYIIANLNFLIADVTIFL